MLPRSSRRNQLANAWSSKLACLELEGREGVGRSGEQGGGVELLLEPVTEAAPRLGVQDQPPLRGLGGRSCGAEGAEIRPAATRREAGSGPRERGQRRRHRLRSVPYLLCSAAGLPARWKRWPRGSGDAVSRGGAGQVGT